MSNPNEHDDSFGGVERRRDGGLNHGRVARMIEDGVNEALSNHRAEIIGHIDDKFGELKGLIESAFPNGDPHGHRLSHEAQIKTAAFWDRIKASLFEKLAFGVVSGTLFFLAMAAWEAVKAGAHAK